MKRNALVLGGARGIGRAIAEAFNREGFGTAITSRSQNSLAECPFARGYQCDVVDEQSLVNVATRIHKDFGHIDVLVINPGIAVVKPVQEITREEFEDVMRVNVTGAFLATQKFLPLLKSGSLIVFVSSIAGRTSFPNWSAYCASKFALNGFAQAVREELRPLGIRVTILMPGAVNTEIWDGIPDKDEFAMMKSEDIAEAVLSLTRQPANVSIDELMITPAAGAL